MPTERQAPDAILGTPTNLSGAVTDIDDDPDSPDANWMTASSNNVATDVRVSFPTPTGNPTVGTDVQNFRFQVRKSATSGTGTPTARAELWENGTLIRAGLENNVTSTSGQVFAFTWNANELGTANGSLVELKVVGTQSGGGPSVRASVDVGAVEWNVDYTTGGVTGSGTATLPALTVSAAADVLIEGSGALSFAALAASGSTSLPAISGTGTAVLPALQVPFGHGQGPPPPATTQWFFRNGTGVACGPGTRRDLQDAAGASVATQDISSEQTWNRAEATPRSVKAGDWSLTLRVTTGNGGGGPNKVSAVIERRNASCLVQETILNQQSGNLTAGATETIVLTQSAVPQIDFQATDILTVRVFRSAGGRAQTLRFNGSSPDNTAFTHPAVQRDLAGSVSFPALDASGAGSLAGGATSTGSAAISFPAVIASGVAENTRKLDETFDAQPGYDRSNWVEEFSEFSGLKGELDEDFLTANLPITRPSGWGSQCLKVVRLAGLIARAISPNYGTQAKAYHAWEFIIGSELLEDNEQVQLFACGNSALQNECFRAHLRQISGNLRLRFEVETSLNTYTTHDWATNLSFNQKYRVEFYWNRDLGEYEIWVDGSSAFSGSNTSGRFSSLIFLGGDDTTGPAVTFYVDRVGVDSQARLPAATPELPALTASGAGAVAVQGTGSAAFAPISTFRSLLWDSTEWTWDTTAITWDSTQQPTSDAVGGVLVSASGAVNFPALFAVGAGSVAVVGSGSASLPAIQASGVGSALAGVTGSGSVSLAALLASGAGSVRVQGLGTAALAVFSASGQGTVDVQGAGTISIPAIMASASGQVSIKGAGSVSLPALSAQGFSSNDVHGTAAISLPAFSTSGAGTVDVQGAGVISFPSLQASGVAAVEIQGAGTASLAALSGTGTASVAITGSAAVSFPAIQASGTASGQQSIAGSGALTFPSLSASGTGELQVQGSGAASLPTISVAGSGTVLLSAEGIVQLPAFTATGNAEVQVQGTGTVLLPMLSASGFEVGPGQGPVVIQLTGQQIGTVALVGQKGEVALAGQKG